MGPPQALPEHLQGQFLRLHAGNVPSPGDMLLGYVFVVKCIGAGVFSWPRVSSASHYVDAACARDDPGDAQSGFPCAEWGVPSAGWVYQDSIVIADPEERADGGIFPHSCENVWQHYGQTSFLAVICF